MLVLKRQRTAGPVLLFGALLLCGTVLPAADDSESSLTARVDWHLQAGWKNAGIQPAPPATDGVFLRRAYLDLTGRIPTTGEVRRFLNDNRPDKRARLIDRLLGAPGEDGQHGNSRHATHLANIWLHTMLPQVGDNVRYRFQARQFELWLRNHFADNTPYNELVTELLTYTGPTGGNGPGLYYRVLEAKPEELAASTSRIFLGVQIQCAQCHDHPFDHWTQNDFWGYAAFFARLQQPNRRQRFLTQVNDSDSGDVTLPGSETVVAPRFLGARSAKTASGQTRRRQVAAWLTSKDNPYFAQATVNRVWAMLFGRGLVDPVDDFGTHNPSSHPELLNELAADFAAHGYNLRRLFRILAKSRAYQLCSEVRPGEADSPRLFHRMAVKSLTPEQIYDCLNVATAKRDDASLGRSRSRYAYDREKQQFLAKFEAPTQGATEFQGGIPQALTMMNGTTVAAATNLQQSDLLIALTEAPFLNNEQRVEALFLATLSRMPTLKERARFVAYVESGGGTNDTRAALSDVLWALLNSTEFLLNH